MTGTCGDMGQSKIEVFRRILGDEAARRGQQAFEEHYARSWRGGAIAPLPGAEDLARAAGRGRQDRLATGFSP